MSWCIGRTEAIADPLNARLKAMAKLKGIDRVDGAENLVMTILVDAILMAESYRGARHQVDFLPDLTRDVDALIRELNLVERAEELAVF